MGENAPDDIRFTKITWHKEIPVKSLQTKPVLWVGRCERCDFRRRMGSKDSVSVCSICGGEVKVDG